MITTPSLRHTAIALVRLLLAGVLVTVWAGLPDSLYSAPEATIWYVAPGGSDASACTSAAQPCEHIQAAINKAASGGTINIAAGTYIEELNITDKNLTLNGQGAAGTFLDGGQIYRVLSISRNSVSRMTVNVSGVTLRNGRPGQAGGAVSNDDSSYLTISNSAIVNNVATNGGGIYNQGVMKPSNVTVRNNSLAGGSEGGGIYNSGYLELSGVLLRDNQALSGGGISNRNTITVTSSSIISNTSNGVGGGGGIYNPASNGKLILLNSTLSQNKAFTGDGGAILNKGILTSTKTIILGNTTTNAGGGIYNGTGGRVTLVGNSIQNNTAVFEGGGLYNSGKAQIDRTSITNNDADTTGGGLNNTGTTTMTNVTVSDNTSLSGSGIFNGGTLSMKFSTVSHNTIQDVGGVTAGNSILDNACSAPIASAGYNIDTGTSCGLGGTNDLSSTDPQPGTLQDNGGGTFTRAIALSSAAVDSANDGVCPPTDQRGLARPKGSHCDRGAYEVVGYSQAIGLSIGGGACVTSTLSIVDQYFIGRVQVGVNLTYINRSHLRIRLLSPGSPKVTLLEPAAGSHQNLDTMFDDSASTGVPPVDQNTNPPYYEGPYKPSTPLAPMRGISTQGNWKLEICSSSISEFGTLNRWVLVVPEVLSSFKVYLPVIRR